MPIAALSRRRAARPAAPGGTDGDAGVTMLEVTVAMSVMAVVTALAVAGVVQVFGTSNRAEALVSAQAQAHNAFIRLDRDIRYASGISKPGQVGGNQYVEYTLTNSDVTTCTQLRLTGSSGLLQSRSRRSGEAVGPWQTLASYVTTPRQFTRTLPADTGAPYQQLDVLLTLRAGAGATTSRRQSSYRFAALNTTDATASDTVCGNLGRP
jgi:prepilin-type N-terminal cleavage/methylation domain-containing protein